MGIASNFLGLGAITSCFVSCFSAAACFRTRHCCDSKVARVAYAIMLLLNSILAWVMMSDWVAKKLEKNIHKSLQLNCPEGSCFGVLTVHRICFALSLFHFILGGLVVGVKDTRDPRAAIQNGWWGPKVIFWISLIIGTFFIPNDLFLFWGNYVSLIGATIFILVGLILLVDFAHTWSEKCLDKYDQSNNNKWKIILIWSTLLMFAGAILMTSLMYEFFAGSGCSVNQFFISFNLILCVLGILLCIQPKIQEGNPRSGLSQASMVVIYCTYLILSAVTNEPPHDMCNPLKSPHKTRQTSVVFGSLFTFLAIAYSTSRTASQGKALLMNYLSSSDHHYKYHRPKDEQSLPSKHFPDDDDVERRILPSSSLVEKGEKVSYDPVDGKKHEVAYNYVFFHFIFAIAAMYVAMLLTNWNTITITGNEKLVAIGQSFTIVWVKVISSWICFLLYYWSLLAPVLFPDRFYGLKESYKEKKDEISKGKRILGICKKKLREFDDFEESEIPELRKFLLISRTLCLADLKIDNLNSEKSVLEAYGANDEPDKYETTEERDDEIDSLNPYIFKYGIISGIDDVPDIVLENCDDSCGIKSGDESPKIDHESANDSLIATVSFEASQELYVNENAIECDDRAVLNFNDHYYERKPSIAVSFSPQDSHEVLVPRQLGKRDRGFDKQNAFGVASQAGCKKVKRV
ncbi:9384_t:CDS:10 [Funneliformis caledonium]|uniref:9384_t:CDS:1 n=1 Tax=Funneliformis caledonium TaxID=1117310 RepID=A0A9N9F695_9GLOM|nr:9384_t:CDS:10 [Funneliformis caledonium]